ncbi:hypothetical protein LMTR3_21140 [Bradyrhizobium sp. LMTR 3]|nr:hypothetical protein LMTR3_21140 [Bradyrhizobium sp. LMTR 3]
MDGEFNIAHRVRGVIARAEILRSQVKIVGFSTWHQHRLSTHDRDDRRGSPTRASEMITSSPTASVLIIALNRHCLAPADTLSVLGEVEAVLALEPRTDRG